MNPPWVNGLHAKKHRAVLGRKPIGGIVIVHHDLPDDPVFFLLLLVPCQVNRRRIDRDGDWPWLRRRERQIVRAARAENQRVQRLA